MRSGDSHAALRSDADKLRLYRAVDTLETLSRRYGVAPEDWIKLNQNENPYGSVPEAQEALRHLPLERYPDSQSLALRDSLARYCSAPMERIVVGNGGDELIDLVLRLLIDPGDEVITCTPTFGFYSVVASLNRAHVVEARRNEAFEVEVQEVRRHIRSNTKVIFLCSPNNPTGTLTPSSTSSACASRSALTCRRSVRRVLRWQLPRRDWVASECGGDPNFE